MRFGQIEIIVIAAVLLNVFVSIFLVRRQDLELSQKIAQIIIVWLIPFVAALGLWLFNRSHDEVVSSNKHSFGGGANDSIGVLPPGEGGGGGD